MENTALLDCRDLLFCESCTALTLALEPGARRTVLVADDESLALLLQTLAGLRRPVGGDRRLFGAEPEMLPETGRRALRRRIGVVADDAGLIANLTVLENLLLPAEYAGGADPQALRAAARAMLQKTGFRGDETLLPGQLRLLQKRQVLLARALLTAPELLLCVDILAGLGARERGGLLETALAWGAEQPRAATLFLTTDPVLAERLGGADVCNLLKGETL